MKIRLDVLKSMKHGGWMVAERWGPKNSLETGRRGWKTSGSFGGYLISAMTVVKTGPRTSMRFLLSVM